MENKIQSSMDWASVQRNMEAPALKMKKYSGEMLKVSRNIGSMVTELSKEEINCRRAGKQTARHKEMIDNINREIANYERMITFALLIVG